MEIETNKQKKTKRRAQGILGNQPQDSVLGKTLDFSRTLTI